MRIEQIEQSLLDSAEPCPWCGLKCMVAELDRYCGVRVMADCDQLDAAFHSDENDANGNDYGRTNWDGSLPPALVEWNRIVRKGRATNQQGVW